jgi:hypothetical protein
MCRKNVSLAAWAVSISFAMLREEQLVNDTHHISRRYKLVVLPRFVQQQFLEHLFTGISEDQAPMRR